MVTWRIYYGDGSTADDQSHTLESLPRWNVQVIIQFDLKHNRNLASRADYYLFHVADNRWYPIDFIGLLDYLAHDFSSIGAILFGRYIPNERFDKIEKKAAVDPSFWNPSSGQGRF